MNPEIVTTFLLKNSLDSMLDADYDAIVDFVMDYRSYDSSKFSELIDNSPDWSCIIASHIHLDHVLGSFLTEYCVRPKSVSSDARRMSVLDKAAFLHGVGVLSDGSLHTISFLNRIRNKFAHELSFDVPEEKVVEFRSTLLSAFSERVYSRREYRESPDGNLDFKLLLKLSVLFVEEERLAHLIVGLKGAQSRANLEDAMRAVRASRPSLQPSTEIDRNW